MFTTTKALVLREVKYKEADRILTLFTADNGKITAKARGALRKSSRTGAATQQLTYADMTLFCRVLRGACRRGSERSGPAEPDAQLALCSEPQSA